MATTIQEINSFVGKFAQLCISGLNASLNLSSCGGNVVANLQADIGRITPTYDDQSNRNNFSSCKKRRRRRRRLNPSQLEPLPSSALDEAFNVNIVKENSNVESGETVSLSASSIVQPSRSSDNSDSFYFEFGDGVSTLLNCGPQYDVKTTSDESNLIIETTEDHADHHALKLSAFDSNTSMPYDKSRTPQPPIS